MVLSPPVCNHQSINQVQRSISRCSISGLLLELCCLCTLSKDFCCSLLYLFKVRGDIFLVGQMRQLFSLISSCCCLSYALPSALCPRNMTLSGFKDSVIELIHFVGRLASVGLQLEGCNALLLSFVLDFYETVTDSLAHAGVFQQFSCYTLAWTRLSCLFLAWFLLPQVCDTFLKYGLPLVVMPPTGVFYPALLATDPVSVDRLAYIMYRWASFSFSKILLIIVVKLFPHKWLDQSALSSVRCNTLQEIWLVIGVFFSDLWSLSFYCLLFSDQVQGEPDISQESRSSQRGKKKKHQFFLAFTETCFGPTVFLNCKELLRQVF